MSAFDIASTFVVVVVSAVNRERAQTIKRGQTEPQRKWLLKLPRVEAAPSRMQAARARQHRRLLRCLNASD